MFKRLKSLIRFIFLSIIVLSIMLYFCRYIFILIWSFDILSINSYKSIYSFWSKGGVFETFFDCSLGFALLLLPFIWLYYTKKLYKFGLLKCFSVLIIKIYRYLTRPKNIDTNVVLKNFGGKTKELDEIIAEKLNNNNSGQENRVSKHIRQEVLGKLQKNE